MPRIVYSPKYNIGFYGLEKLHPFDSKKYGRAWKLLRERFGKQSLSEIHVRPKRQASWDELLRVSTETILKRDLLVVSELRKREIPTVVVLSGGYTKESYRLDADSVFQLVKPSR